MHNIEHGMNPKEATKKAMKEVGECSNSHCVNSAAVFVPVAFAEALPEDCISSLPLPLLSPYCFLHSML